MSDPFFDWFSGFVDGEGCFTVRMCKPSGSRKSRYIEPAFSIILRQDDLAILKEIKRRTGVGRITLYGVIVNRQGVRSNPRARWEVRHWRDCTKLARIFDQHPLRAKKRRDYKIWRQVISYLGFVTRGNRWSGSGRDWKWLDSKIKQLRDGRRFRG